MAVLSKVEIVRTCCRRFGDEELLKHFLCGQRPVQRAMTLIDLVKLVRISKKTKAATTNTPRKECQARASPDLDDNSEGIDELFSSQLNLLDIICDDLDGSDEEDEGKDGPKADPLAEVA